MLALCCWLLVRWARGLGPVSGGTRPVIWSPPGD